MTIYVRTATVIVITAIIIIISGLAVGAYFLTRHMSSAIEHDMMIVVDIADKYIANEIELLKIRAAEAAQEIALSYKAGEREQVLARVQARHPVFIGLAVFAETALLDSWGEAPVPPDLPGEPFMDVARAGGQAMSTTMYSPDGTLVMYVSAPIGDGLILAAILPGQYFSDLLSRFTIYQTGHLFVDDADGHVIVNIRPEWVQRRINFIELAKEDSRYADMAAVIKRGISGEQGTGRFTVDGVPRICAFRPVSSPNEHWLVGLIAPLTESPLKEIPGAMLIIGLLTLALSVVAALLAADLLKRPYEEMERLRSAAIAASKTKSAFLATMSHEIRTPLNAVIGLSELTLGEESLSRETEANLEKIYGAGSTILSIVNDILDISKIESGKFEIYPVQYDIPSLVNDIVTLNAVRIGEKDITFALHVDENLPGTLYGDDLRVRQIFNNLLSNAFKFTHSGTVEWRISFERDGDDFWLSSGIRDTGIGITAENLQKLFLDYNQVDTKTNRNVEGTGLGLAITKSLVEMMDGTITVESEYGKGSTFHVRLRQALASEAPIGKEVATNLMNLRYALSRRAKQAKLARMNLSYAHVLIVDDMETNLDVAKGMLKPYAMNIACAVSGQQAIEMIRAGTPRYSAIFMDHMMPGMDGVEAARIIREEIGTEYARNIPIIALTANALVGNEELFLRQGFQAFISKPIDTVKLDSVLCRWVRNKELEKSLSEHVDKGHGDAGNGDPASGTIAIAGVDVTSALGRFGGNESVFIDVLRSYAANTPQLLENLRMYLATKNMAEYAIAVHGMKGASYGICAQKLGNAAESLEIAAKQGNFEEVKTGHAAFEHGAETLLNAINNTLASVNATAHKPVAAAPAPEILKELREACEAFDMDKVDNAMARLESFRYEKGGIIVTWLREQVDAMAFEEIISGVWPSE